MKTVKVELDNLKFEEGLMDALNAPSMQPYQEYIRAMVLSDSEGATAALAALKALPLEDRYIWRVASALKWAFIDFDSVSVNIDREDVTAEERAKVDELFKLRLMQCTMLMYAWFGKEKADEMLAQSVAVTRDFMTAAPQESK